MLGRDGAHYPLTPERARRRARPLHPRVRAGPRRRLLRHDARAPAPASSSGSAGGVSRRAGRGPRPGVASLYQHVPFRQDTSYLSIGERTNANGSQGVPRRRCSSERWDDCVEIARDQTRDGAHLLDVCIDYVGRDGVADMREVACRFATASTLPLVLDSTEPAVIEAGLETLGGRSVINSVNYEDGDGPDVAVRPRHADRPRARRRRRRADHRRGGPGPHRRVEGAGRDPADRRPHRRTGACTSRTSSSTASPSRSPPARRRPAATALETIEAIREVKRAVPRGADHARGCPTSPSALNPAARVVLNSVFLHECIKAGLDSAIVHAAKILPMTQIPDEQRQVALDLVYDRRRPATDASRLRPAAALPRPVRGRRRGGGPGRRRPRSWPRCRWASGSRGASSTASATASRPTSTRRSTPAARARHHQRQPARAA